MFMFTSEKKRLYDEIELLQSRVKLLESDFQDLKMKYWCDKKLNESYGIKKDGTPKAKPGRKPK